MAGFIHASSVQLLTTLVGLDAIATYRAPSEFSAVATCAVAVVDAGSVALANEFIDPLDGGKSFA